MKSSKFLFQKFQRKYVFLQSSFHDFLYWRSFSKQNKFITPQKEDSQNFLLEQEKICFQDYWKSSEKKKIKTVIENINKEYTSSFQNFEKYESINLLSENDSLKKTEKPLKKNQFSENSRFKMNQNKIRLMNFQQKLKYSKMQPSNRETLIPKSDFFENFNKNKIFSPFQIGEFFPKKKVFQQYWIFPFVGFVILFSTNPSVNFPKKFREKVFEEKNTKTTGTVYSFNNQTDRTLNVFQQYPTSLKTKTVPFFYSEKVEKSKFLDFHEFEKTEFQNFSSFYFQIFQKSALFSSKNQIESGVLKKSAFDLTFQNFKETIHFRKKIEHKRNCLKWQWFSSNFQLFSKKDQVAHIFMVNLPQKAQFFCSNQQIFFSPNKNFENSKSQTDFMKEQNDSKPRQIQSFLSEGNSKTLPVFEFSKTLSLFNEFEKELRIQSERFVNSSFETENFHTSTPQKSFSNFNAQDFYFLNSLDFGKPNQTDPSHLKNSMDDFFNLSENLSDFERNLGSSEEFKFQNKNLFFLKKWFQTHTFSKFQTNFQKKTNFLPFQKVQIESFCFSNLAQLDMLYFQKFLKNLDSLKEKHIQSFEHVHSFSNFNKFLSMKKKFDFSEHQSNQNPLKNFQKSFYSFKKVTFQYFVSQYYKSSWKNFFSSELQSKNIFSTSAHKGFEVHMQHLNDSKIGNIVKKRVQFRKKNMNKICVLERPILFDFSNLEKNSLLSNYFFFQNTKDLDKKNKGFSKSFDTFNPSIFPNLEFQENNVGSASFHFLNTPQIFSFFQRSSEAKSIFQISKNFSVFDFFKKENYQTSGFPLAKQKNLSSLNSKILESDSKFEVLERIFEKTLKNMKTSFLFNISDSELFQKYFLFEKIRQEKPFIFEKSLENSSSFDFKNKKTNSFFQKSVKSVFLKQRPLIFFSNNEIFSYEAKKKRISNFQTRKFEKVFQTFFLPFNREKNNSNFSSSSIQKKSSVSQQKYEKDTLFLKFICHSFSDPFKKSKNVFFSSIFSENNTTKAKSVQKFSVSPMCKQKKKLEQSVLFNENSFEKNFRYQRKHTSNKNFSSQTSNGFEKQICPSFILKRDGFVFVPKLSDEVLSKNHQPVAKISDFDKGTQFRFEKEKSIQKKRRMKKQKLETRRRKKRKRFFPRPIWLRFHLYKKFLNTRHPKQILSSFENSKNFAKGTNSMVSEKKRKNSKNPVFSNSKQTEFVSFLKKRKWKDSFPVDFQKRWKFVFDSSVFQKTKSPHKKLKNLHKQSFENFNKLQQEKLPFQLSTFKNYDFNIQNSAKIYRKNTQKWGFFWKKGFEERKLYKKFLLNSFSNNNGNFDCFFEKPSPISQNIEHYKISGDILSEFLTLSWKSYWFQANWKSYTQRITQNFRKMQKQESQKAWHQYNPQNSFENFEYPFHFCDSSIFKNMKQSDLVFRKSIFKKFSWYSNIRGSLESNLFDSDSMFGIGENIFDSQKLQNFPEYNRILYSRVSEALKNLKSVETANDLFPRDLSKSQQVPKHKNETIFSNFSFFTKFALFSENFNIPNQPGIPALSLFSSLFHNNSMKPTGDLPTLRAYWALSKTNMYQFQERNAVRNLWTMKKRKESFESLKGTKKIGSFLKKNNPFETVNAPTIFDFSTLNESFFSNVEKSPHFKTKTFGDSSQTFTKQTVFEDQELKMKKILFVLKKKNNSIQFLKQLDKICFDKYRNIQNKCSFFGINPLKQNSQFCFRYLKYHLFSKQSKDFLKLSPDQKNQIFENIFKFENSSDQKFLKQANFQNSAKSSLNFWWAQKNSQPFDFVFCSQRRAFSNIDFFMLAENNFSTEQSSPVCFYFGHNEAKRQGSEIDLKKQVLKFDFSRKNFQYPRVQFLWFGAIIFHLAILFTLFKIPEIRTVLKFQCILFYKVMNSFLPVIFSIFHFFNKYRKIANMLGMKIVHKYSVFKKKDELPFFNFPPFSEYSTFSQKSPDFFSDEKMIHMKFIKQNILFFNSQEFVVLKNSKSSLMEVFIRLSKYSNEMCFNSKKQDSFFSFFAKYQKEKNMLFSNLPSVSKISELSSEIHKGIFVAKLSRFKQAQFSESSFETQFNENIVRFSSKKNIPFTKSEKMIAELAICFLLVGKVFPVLCSNILMVSSKLSGKVLDIIEMILFSIYKFLEKPAELMIEWIASIFLIEWSSDIATFVPDTLDISVFQSSQKFSRSFKAGSIVLSFLTSKNQFVFASFSNQFGSPFLFVNFFSSSILMCFLFQKRLLSSFEHFPTVLLQADKDILIRQKKGMIFWDIWAEILLKGAEKYNVNIPSFVTLKEEQELFVEKLLQDKQFLKNLRSSSVPLFFNQKNTETNSELFSGESLQQKSLASFIENFLIQERPENLDQYFSSHNMINPFVLSQIVSFESFSFFQKFSNFQPQKSDVLLSTSLKSTKLKLFGNQFENNLFSQISKKSASVDRWSANQYGTYQGPETDLFIDLHPPKSLKHIQFFKYYEPAQYTLGTLICQIYSGIFSKQVSKNILVIGAPGTAKTLFIQALAGETEMKIITDNAYRYAMVQRGVAVGMKYLRDVFDALALQTPCFFLMEHIHVIGSKRPLLISDDQNVRAIQSSFGLEQQEVHESNQMIYQLNRHSISDYKRPYKGDFSMGIPTNFFIQNFYSLFEKNSHSVFQNSQFSLSPNRSAPTSPLPIDSVERSLFNQGLAQKEKTDLGFHMYQNSIQSRLQIAKQQIFAPPATSPFTILMMKEQKKLKPKKIVLENSWGGLSADQFLSYQKESFSVRAKVALLADITMNLSRGKLDMITDLLVIIDSVRSNRGFVVFATTHLPSLLDPALRRPGRFDETLSLSQSPNFLNRFEIFKMNFQNCLHTFDFLDSSVLTENFSELDLFSFLNRTKLSFFHEYTYTDSFSSEFAQKFFKKQRKTISQVSPSKAFQKTFNCSVFLDLFLGKFHSQKSLNSSTEKTVVDKYFLRDLKLSDYTVLPKGPSHTLNLAYSKVGIFVAESNLLKNPFSFIPMTLDKKINCFQNQKFLGNVFYDSQKQQQLQLMVFLSSKVAEFFVQKNLHFLSVESQFNRKKSNILMKTSSNLSFELFEKKFGSVQNFRKVTMNFEKQNNQQIGNIGTRTDAEPKLFKNDFFWTTFGTDELWRSATPFLFSIIQKRFLFTKNLLLSKMLFFENNNQLKLPPSPPNSSILMPAKKYENFKRSDADFIRKPRFSIQEKIQLHQQQRFLKQLYNIPVQQYFQSEMIQNRKTSFSSSFQELAYLDSVTRRSSSSDFYYKKYLCGRHRFSTVNQWWNGLLPEHNLETTYLSDVDWRTMFGKIQEKTQTQKFSQNVPANLLQKQSDLLKKSTNSVFEFLMDFPDAEQYYNPRNRRWYFNSKTLNKDGQKSSYWFTFHTDLQYEISYHYLMYSFHQTFEFFNEHREMLDFFVFHLLTKGFLKELDYLTGISRFQKFE